MTARWLALAAVVTLGAGCAGFVTDSPTLPKWASNEMVVPSEALNPDVRQETIHQTICVPGYTASVRPSTTYTNGVKAKLLRETGRSPSAAPDFELDHRVPLALGGHPRSVKNLELQSWEGEDGAKKKDRLERRLQRLVCSNRLALRTAQSEMYFNWQAAAAKY